MYRIGCIECRNDALDTSYSRSVLKALTKQGHHFVGETRLSCCMTHAQKFSHGSSSENCRPVCQVESHGAAWVAWSRMWTSDGSVDSFQADTESFYCSYNKEERRRIVMIQFLSDSSMCFKLFQYREIEADTAEIETELSG